MIVENKTNKIITWNQTFKKNILIVVLILATFFNPLGFAELFHWVEVKTGSFIVTDIIFYFISIFFFGLYYFLQKKWKNDK